MKKAFFLLAVIVFLSCQSDNVELPDGLYARIETSKGDIVVSLNYEKSPITVANFITLAEGKNPYVTDEFKGKPFYDGLTFHRVIKEFMIQGGDPYGNGSGGPGYRFRDEFSDLAFDKPGILAMANAGPTTNGSQFFITHKDTPWLNGKHTIFGEVTGEGMETVNSIENGDLINSVTIIRKGEAAKRFDALKIFNDYVTTDKENREKQKIADDQNRKLYEEKFKDVIAKKSAEFAAMKAVAKKTKSGLRYKILKDGNGKKPKKDSPISVNYAGYLESGRMVYTNIAEIAKMNGLYFPEQETRGVYKPLEIITGRYSKMFPGFGQALSTMSYGEKALFFIPSELAFGPQGAGGVVPPNADLIFEIELLP